MTDSLTQRLNKWLAPLESYPAGKTFEEIATQYGFKESQILRLAGNETTLGPSPMATAAARKQLDKSHFYAEPFAESLTLKLEKKFALDSSKAGIVIGNGMDSVIDHLSNLLLDKDSSIIIQSPTFVYYASSAERLGAEVIDTRRTEAQTNIAKANTDAACSAETKADTNATHETKSQSNTNTAYQIDTASIIQAIKPNTKIIYICTPNNPTGNSFTKAEIEYLAQETLKRNVYLFVDEAYIEFSEHPSVVDLVSHYPNLIVGRTFSKAYALAGFRVGYGIMPAELKKQYQKIMVPFLVARPSIAAASAALDDTKHLNKVAQTAIKGREQLAKELSRLKLEHYPSDANFILFKTSKPAAEIIEGLSQHGVIIRAQKSVCSKALRVTVGSRAENLRFIRALEITLNQGSKTMR